jgi:hypothetical protein
VGTGVHTCFGECACVCAYVCAFHSTCMCLQVGVSLGICQATRTLTMWVSQAYMFVINICGHVIVAESVHEHVSVCACVRQLACAAGCVRVCLSVCRSLCPCVAVGLCLPWCCQPASCRASQEQPPCPPHCCLLSSFAEKGSPGGR